MKRTITMLIASILLLGVISYVRLEAQNKPVGPGIQISLAVKQPGSPVGIISSTAIHDFLFDRVAVVNKSSETVASITFGAMLYFATPSGLRTAVITGRAIPCNIKSGGQETVSSFLLPVKVVYNRPEIANATAVRAEIGVLEVDFASGLQWDYDIQEKGSFDPVSAKRQISLLAPPRPGKCGLPNERLQNVSVDTSPSWYFTCIGAAEPL